MPTTRCITMVSTWCSTSSGRARVGEAGGESLGQPDRPVGLAQQQGTGVRGDRATVEAGYHAAAFDGWKFKQGGVTLCRHWGVLWIREKPCLQHDFFQNPRPNAPDSVRNAG